MLSTSQYQTLIKNHNDGLLIRNHNIFKNNIVSLYIVVRVGFDPNVYIYIFIFILDKTAVTFGVFFFFSDHTWEYPHNASFIIIIIIVIFSRKCTLLLYYLLHVL